MQLTPYLPKKTTDLAVIGRDSVVCAYGHLVVSRVRFSFSQTLKCDKESMRMGSPHVAKHQNGITEVDNSWDADFLEITSLAEETPKTF